MEIVEKYYHSNGNCVPFVVAIVDDPEHNDTKLVIMFEDYDYTAVLSLDTLIEHENITPEENGYSADKYEQELRDELWTEDEDEYYEEEDEESELF